VKSNLVWSSSPEVMEENKTAKTVFVVVEDCCQHFSGVFATEQEAKKVVEEFGDGYSYLEEGI
jgi:Cys-tRNA synthase (O-phospho-L-seryl-tRNA:Cys-tRNA synthase)